MYGKFTTGPLSVCWIPLWSPGWIKRWWHWVEAGRLIRCAICFRRTVFVLVFWRNGIWAVRRRHFATARRRFLQRGAEKYLQSNRFPLFIRLNLLLFELVLLGVRRKYRVDDMPRYMWNLCEQTKSGALCCNLVGNARFIHWAYVLVRRCGMLPNFDHSLSSCLRVLCKYRRRWLSCRWCDVICCCSWDLHAADDPVSLGCWAGPSWVSVSWTSDWSRRLWINSLACRWCASSRRSLRLYYGFESFVVGYDFDKPLAYLVYRRSAEIGWTSVIGINSWFLYGLGDRRVYALLEAVFPLQERATWGSVGADNVFAARDIIWEAPSADRWNMANAFAYLCPVPRADAETADPHLI